MTSAEYQAAMARLDVLESRVCAIQALLRVLFAPVTPKEVAMAKKKLTKTKAKQILHDGEVRGHPLTTKQRGLFGAAASGKRLRKKR